jgi:excisionase family DNA binding protein
MQQKGDRMPLKMPTLARPKIRAVLYREDLQPDGSIRLVPITSRSGMLSLQEVASILGVSYATAWRLTTVEGKISFHRMGVSRCIQVRLEDLQSYIEQTRNAD